MTISALVYGGVQISRMSPKAHTTYDGVYFELNGSTLNPRSGLFVPASCSFEMNPSDALDVALLLIRSAEKHGQQTDKQVDCLIKRLTKSRVKK